MALLVSPQAVGFCCFWLVLLGCFVVGYSGMAWFGYLMFLAYLGGLLVVFLYSMVLASSPYFGGVVGFFLFLWVFFLVVVVLGLWSFSGGGSEIFFLSSGGSVSFFTSSNFEWLGNLWTFSVMGGLLLMCMVSVTKICSGCGGSLRCFK
nr:NADH dehydrogenase subunit 6 [Catillopecten margaritatus]